MKDEEKTLGVSLLGHNSHHSWKVVESDDSLASDEPFSSSKAKRNFWPLHASLLAINLVVLFSILYRGKQDSCDPRHGVDFVYCKFTYTPSTYPHIISDILTIISHLAPAREAVTYEARTFNTSLFARNKYNGTPRPESSDAWEEISEGKHLVK